MFSKIVFSIPCTTGVVNIPMEEVVNRMSLKRFSKNWSLITFRSCWTLTRCYKIHSDGTSVVANSCHYCTRKYILLSKLRHSPLILIVTMVSTPNHLKNGHQSRINCYPSIFPIKIHLKISVPSPEERKRGLNVNAS